MLAVSGAPVRGMLADLEADLLMYPVMTLLPCLQLPTGAHGGQPNDTWISGRTADLSGQASQEQLNNEQLAAAQEQAGVSFWSCEYFLVHEGKAQCGAE